MTEKHIVYNIVFEKEGKESIINANREKREKIEKKHKSRAAAAKKKIRPFETQLISANTMFASLVFKIPSVICTQKKYTIAPMFIKKNIFIFIKRLTSNIKCSNGF